MTRSAICPISFFIYKWRSVQRCQQPCPPLAMCRMDRCSVRGSELFLWWLKPGLRVQHSQQALQLAGREAASEARLCGHSWATRAVSILCRATADLSRTPLFSPRTIKKTCRPSHCTLSSPLLRSLSEKIRAFNGRNICWLH